MPAKRFPIRLPALKPLEVPQVHRTIYPPPHDKVVNGRYKRRLGPALGLTDLGVSLTTLMPGAATALRHWHAACDEFVYVLDGTATLVTNDGAQALTARMCCGYPKGKADGHNIVNETDRPVLLLEVSTNVAPDVVTYPDTKLYVVLEAGGKPTFSKTKPTLAKPAAASKASPAKKAKPKSGGKKSRHR